MSNEDRRKRVEKVGVPDCDQVRCPKLDGVLKAVLPRDAIKADGYLSRLQQFWLDAVAPLAALLESAEAGELTPEKAVSAAQTALYLMGNVHQQTAQERRKKLILKLNPSLKFMAEDAKSFSSAAPMLFGEEFAKQATATVEQMKAMKKLNIPSEKKGHFSGYHPRSYQSGRRGEAKSGHRYEIPIILQGNRTARPVQPSRTEQQSESKKLKLVPNCVNCQKEIINCHHTLSLSVILPSIKREIVTSLHVGRIKEFIENWALITQDPWVLQTVQGFQLPLVGQPTQATAPPQLQLSLEQQDLVSTEVQAIIEKRAISGVRPDQRGFVSQIFLVPKKDGGHRPVVNLKALNKFIVEEHFKMEGFHMVKDLVKPGDWLAKLDLKDAYFLVPVDPNHQKFLQFQWQGNLYQFHCLPFGLSCTPRTFTKLMKPVVAFLRERGI